MTSPKSLRIAVLVASDVQLLDMSCVDLFAMLDQRYLIACNMPPPLIEQGLSVSIHYVGETGAGTTGSMTANVTIGLTDSVHDDAVQPGKLDILLIPGPDPRSVPSEAVKGFVKNHFEHGTAVLSICTGSLVIGHSGITKGKTVSGPQPLVPTLKQVFPEGHWVAENRWERDGSLWSSGKYQTSCIFLCQHDVQSHMVHDLEHADFVPLNMTQAA